MTTAPDTIRPTMKDSAVWTAALTGWLILAAIGGTLALALGIWKVAEPPFFWWSYTICQIGRAHV